MKPVDPIPPGEWSTLLKVFADVTELFGGDSSHALRDIWRALAGGKVAAMVQTLADGKCHGLPADFWQQGHKPSSVGPNHVVVRSKEYPPMEHRYFLRQGDVETVWRLTSETPAAANKAWWSKSAAGAKGDYNWERIVGRAALYMHVNGVPKSLADLCDEVEKMLPANKAPSETQLRDHLRPIYLDFKEARP